MLRTSGDASAAAVWTVLRPASSSHRDFGTSAAHAATLP